MDNLLNYLYVKAVILPKTFVLCRKIVMNIQNHKNCNEDAESYLKYEQSRRNL